MFVADLLRQCKTQRIIRTNGFPMLLSFTRLRLITFEDFVLPLRKLDISKALTGNFSANAAINGTELLGNLLQRIEISNQKGECQTQCEPLRTKAAQASAEARLIFEGKKTRSLILELV